ncbi:MAG: hypothetical protein KA791_08490 [Flavobacteriales bacterium]|nr:hypothetical protein [Flavobacteriales bacterium]
MKCSAIHSSPDPRPRLLLTGVFAAALSVALAQPGNDNPCGAEVLTPGTTCVNSTWSNVAATATAGPPAPGCGSYLGGDVWFQLTIPTGGTVTVTTGTVGGSALTDSGLGFYTAATCAGPFTLVGCNDDFAGTMSQLTYTGTPGATLWIRVWEYGNNAFGAFNICATTPPPPATNNDPCGATPLTAGASCVYTMGSNSGATATAGPPAPTCSFYGGGDVWFQVTIPAGGSITLTGDVAGGSLIADMGMAVYTAPSCSGPFTQVACDDDSGPGLMPMITYTGTAGTVLWVRMWEYGNDTFGSFNICATTPTPPPPPPTNNDPCAATLVTVGTTCTYTTYTNVGSTNSTTLPAPGCGAFGAGSLDIWFRFVAPASGIAIIQSQAGTLTDGAMALYYDAPPLGCATPFTLVQCDDDSGPGLMPFLSFTNLVPGGTYYIRFWGFSTSAGTFGLCVNGPTSVPAGACVYALQLFDSFGDGWGTSSVGISINGGPFTNYSTTGSYNVVLIGLNPGNVLVVQYNATGAGQAENSYRLTMQSNGSTVFNSGVPPTPGIAFTQTVTCQPPPSPPQDCSGGITICNGQAFNNNSNNTGNVVDLNAGNQGCLSSGERQGTWYYFSPSSAGNIGFTIAPVAPTDYDFALWGPLSSIACPPVGPPLRCSYSALYANTGLGNGATDPTEGAGGDAWVSTIPVTAGQIYILYVDNFSSNGQAFNLTWQLSGGASLDCTVLPVELLSFHAFGVEEGVSLKWATATEQNSDRFEIERSVDGEHFALIGTLPSVGNSTQELHYDFLDRLPYQGLNHYRLRHVDIDGDHQYSPVETVHVERKGEGQILLVPNPGGGQVQVILPEKATGSTFVMSDAVGQDVLRIRAEGARISLDLSRLAHGVYGYRLLSTAGAVLARGTWIRE